MSELSPREREVLDLAGEGKSNKEIAQLLYISLNTVKSHLIHIYVKLGAENRANAIKITQTD